MDSLNKKKKFLINFKKETNEIYLKYFQDLNKERYINLEWTHTKSLK